MNQLLIAILLTLFPLVELRGGLVVALIYASKNNIPTFPIFLLIIILNILLIFLIFFFLDTLHVIFLKNSKYRKFYNFYLKSMQKRIKKFEKRYESLDFLALLLFVAIPLPFTGAYSASFLSWILNLNRKKSILAISLGILIAGLIIYLGTEFLIF